MIQDEFTKKRFAAALIDVFVAAGLWSLFLPKGWLLAGSYWLIRDGFFEGQSIGKRLMGLKVVVHPKKLRCTVLESVIRNVLWVIPFVQIVMACTSLYYLANDRAGRHWGDRLADTRVVPA